MSQAKRPPIPLDDADLSQVSGGFASDVEAWEERSIEVMPTPGLLATNGDDNLYASLNTSVSGYGGNDVLNASSGNETLRGGSGDDTLRGGVGSDSMGGGSGQDSLNGDGSEFSWTPGRDMDVLREEDHPGKSFQDTLDGGMGDDTLVGGMGADLISGGDGNDVIIWRAGEGNDTIHGGAGRDTLQIPTDYLDSLSIYTSDGAQVWDGSYRPGPDGALMITMPTSSGYMLLRDPFDSAKPPVRIEFDGLEQIRMVR